MAASRSVRFVLLGGLFIGVAGAAPIGRADSAQEQEQPGRSPFERVCSNCHGMDAKGATGPSLLPFTRTDDELLAIVREGGAQMMAFSRKDVSDEAARAIAAYLRSLTGREEARRGAATSGSVGVYRRLRTSRAR